MITVTCQHCRREFRAYPSDQRTYCSRSCVWEAQRERQRGKAPVHANRVRRGQQMADAREALRQQFGELSVREIALFKFVYWWAYRKGYGTAYRQQRRIETQERAA